MTMTPAYIERLRTAWDTGTERYRDDRECPDAGQIFEAVAGRGETRLNRAIVTHIAHCGACAESWRIASALQQEIPGEQPRARASNRFGFPATWGLAAAAVLALTIGIISLRPVLDLGVPAPGEPGALRGVTDLPLTLETADGARLPAEDFRLTWQPLDNVLTYQVEIIDESLKLVFATETRQAEIEVPPGRLDDLEAGSGLHWYVIAVLEDGREARSETRAVIIEENL